MMRKLIALGLFIAAMGVMLAASEPAGAADEKKVDKKKLVKKKAAKKKAEPLNTDAIFKKLDANSDNKLDVEEFKKLFTVQPEPKGKKGKELGPFDLDFTFKSLDANSDKFLTTEEFKGIVPAIFRSQRNSIAKYDPLQGHGRILWPCLFVRTTVQWTLGCDNNVMRRSRWFRPSPADRLNFPRSLLQGDAREGAFSSDVRFGPGSGPVRVGVGLGRPARRSPPTRPRRPRPPTSPNCRRKSK